MNLEFDCWSRGFDYEEYVRYCGKVNPQYTTIDEESYKDSCDIFETDMINDMGV